MYSHPYHQSINKKGFGLGISAGVPIRKITRSGNVYFAMPNLTEYEITLLNGNTQICNATVYVDNMEIGTWKIEAFSSIAVGRSSGGAQKFVFIQKDNVPYQTLTQNYNTNGSLKVVFKPVTNKQKISNSFVNHDEIINAKLIVDDSLYSQTKILSHQKKIPQAMDDSYYNYNKFQNANSYIPYVSTNYYNKYYYFDQSIGKYYTYPIRHAYSSGSF